MNVYNGGITREQFLFREARIVAKLKLDGYSDSQILEEVKEHNLLQYPTEKMISNIAQVCIKRLAYLEDINLIHLLANGNYETAKQIHFYSLLKKERILREFMLQVIAQKYQDLDFSFSKSDIKLFLNHLRDFDEGVASWSDKTMIKIGQVLQKMLLEMGYLDKHDSKTLNKVLLEYEVERLIIDNGDKYLLPIFNKVM